MTSAGDAGPLGRWVGIDEAGYGPNLGPLVMTAVVAEGPAGRRPDLWADLGAAVTRAGGDVECLWVDDSKAIYRGGQGRDRLEAACLAALGAAGGTPPGSLGALLERLEAGTLADVELSRWLEADPPFPCPPTRVRLDGSRDLRAFDGAPWRLVAVRSIVVGPARFNEALDRFGSKALVHFNAFSRLLCPLWQSTAEGVPTEIRGDKHGGRHFYYDLLLEALPDVWIDRGPEGPELSRYTLRAPGRRLDLSLAPRADAGDGLVALASIVSKAVRECWMDAFNAHWTARIAGLKPTAGYPGDAARFRRAIEADCLALGLAPSLWWRDR